MKKATVFISTAAMMAGTACGVYAETGDNVMTSFDHKVQNVHEALPQVRGMDKHNSEASTYFTLEGYPH